MSYKIRLPDDRYLEIGVRESVDEESEARIIPIEELEPETDVEEDVESTGGRRIGRYLALVGIVAGSLLVVRSLRRRGGEESTRVEIAEEDELAAK